MGLVHRTNATPSTLNPSTLFELRRGKPVTFNLEPACFKFQVSSFILSLYTALMTFFLTSVFIVLVMWRPQEWLVPGLFGWPVLDIVVSLSVLTFMLENDTGRIRIPANVPQFKLLIGLVIAAAMSHIVHTYLGGMLAAIPIVFKFCFFTMLLITLLDRVERIRVVMALILAMSCVMAWHALLQQYRGVGFAGLAPMFDERLKDTVMPYRSYFFGIFSDPNDLCQMLATSIPLAFAIPRRLNFFSFLGCSAVAALLLAGALATHSRGGMIALLSVAGVMGMLVLPARWLPWCMSAAVLAGLVIMPLAAGGMLDESAHDRVVFWGQANYAFKSNPLFGIGYDMFWQVARGRAAHNAFVDCYTELGLFGYTFWFGLLFLGLLGTWRVRPYLRGGSGSRERWLRRMTGLLIASVIGFAASSYFLSRAFQYPLFFLFALMAAVPVAAREFLPEGAQRRIITGNDVVIFTPLVSIASVIYIYVSILLLNKAYG